MDEDSKGIIEDILNEDPKLEREEEHKKNLRFRIETKKREIEAAETGVAELDEERRQKLQYIQESSERALLRGTEALDMVGRVRTDIEGILERSVALNMSQKNLTSMITAVERLRCFRDNIRRLEESFERREYAPMANLVLSMQQLGRTFLQIREARIVANLEDKAMHLEGRIEQHIYDVFEEGMRKSKSGRRETPVILGHCANIIDAIGDAAVERLKQWYCGRQLRDYTSVFRETRELSGLEGMPKRFAWLKRLLIVYEAEHALIFPTMWRVEEELCVAFASATAQDVAGMTQCKSGDVVLLEAAVRQTKTFETFLERKFQRAFGLAEAFAPHLHRIVAHHDKRLAKYVMDLPYKLTETDFDEHGVLCSAPALFLQFRDVLTELCEVTHGQPLLDQALSVAVQLRGYAKYLMQTRSNAAPVKTLAVLLNTAEYCQVTLTQMEERIQAMLSEEFREQISYDGVRQEFLVQTAVLMSRLMKLVEMDRIMPTLASSDNVGVLRKDLLLEMAPVLRGILPAAVYVGVCDRLVQHVLKHFHEKVLTLSSINEEKAQQLLQDLQDIKMLLLDLLRSDHAALRPSLQKTITMDSRRVEQLLKTILLPATPPSVFIQQYLLLTADPHRPTLMKILELKSIKRPQPYLEEFARLLPDRPSAPAKGRFFRVKRLL